MDLNNARLISSKRIEETGQGPGWEVLIEIDNPFPNQPKGALKRTLHAHHFPDTALTWRAAEYDIDPSDVDTLLDIVLNELHIRPEEIEQGTTLADAPDTETAKQAHLRRCARVKLRHRLSTRENKSVRRAKAADPNDPMTAEQAEEDHPLSPIRSYAQNLGEQIAECRRVLKIMNSEVR